MAKINNYYQQGELIGKDGIERQYEKILRGKKGKIVNTKIQKIDMEYVFSIFTLIGFSFFMVLTHMHENHVLYALAGSLILVLLNKKYFIFSIVFSVSSFFSLDILSRITRLSVSISFSPGPFIPIPPFCFCR